ncbi:MAG TPA: C2H2-type zinc finger protein [Myxococcota bacterium]|nr:C2H2-type zinc finger protein [Myxococcota bacterium]
MRFAILFLVFSGAAVCMDNMDNSDPYETGYLLSEDAFSEYLVEYPEDTTVMSDTQDTPHASVEDADHEINQYLVPDHKKLPAADLIPEHDKRGVPEGRKRLRSERHNLTTKKRIKVQYDQHIEAQSTTAIISEKSAANTQIDYISKDRSHICSWSGCNLNFDNDQSYYDHGRNEHCTKNEDGKFVCKYATIDGSICDKKFKRKDHFISHARTHTGERSYKCKTDGCEKAFPNSTALAQHEKTHSKEGEYVCKYCKKTFDNSSNYQRHVNSHTKEKVFTCVICGDEFPDQSNYKRHLSKHSQEEDFLCTINGCGKGFPNADRLANHEKTHKTDRPFKCTAENCEKTFKTKGHLKDHIASAHETERRFKCEHPECPKAFASKQQLNRHKKTHRSNIDS